MILKYPRSINSGISQNRHGVASKDISITNQASKNYL